MNIEIRNVGNTAAADWDAYVRNSLHASHYHQYEWRSFFTDLCRKQTIYLAAYQGDSVVGLLPLVRQKSWLFGDFLVSLPFLNYGGILASDDNVAKALVDHTSELAESLGVTHVEFREYERRSGLKCRTDKVSMRLELPSTSDELAKNLGSKRRSQIKRPLREGPETKIGGIELVDKFYDVFSRNMRDLGTPVYAKSMFIDILNRFSSDTNIVIVEISGRPAAAAFLLHHRSQTEVPWASTDRQFNNISINMFLYWQILEFSIERGSTIFDFGRSSLDSGTYRFKKQWGAMPTQLYWNYWVREGGSLPKLNPDNSKYAAAIGVWKKLPVPISNLLGPHIVSYLP